MVPTYLAMVPIVNIMVPIHSGGGQQAKEKAPSIRYAGLAPWGFGLD
jgi:hypothetical protein